jgi:hypothetical protein
MFKIAFGILIERIIRGTLIIVFLFAMLFLFFACQPAAAEEPSRLEILQQDLHRSLNLSPAESRRMAELLLNQFSDDRELTVGCTTDDIRRGVITGAVIGTGVAIGFNTLYRLGGYNTNLQTTVFDAAVFSVILGSANASVRCANAHLIQNPDATLGDLIGIVGGTTWEWMKFWE